MRDENKLTINLEALKETKLLFRDEEVEEILLCMKNGINAYICGSVGTGKTTAVKNAVEKFNDSRNKAIYISCHSCHTVYSTLCEIIDQINAMSAQKIFIQTRSNFDLVRRLKKERERKFQSVKVVVLDDIEDLEEPGVVYHLIFDIGFNVVLLSDDLKAINRLGAEMWRETIQFKDYTQEQIVRILGSKARCIIGEGLYVESLVRKVAELCKGDITSGESLILGSLIGAIHRHKECVDEEDVPEVLATEREPGFDEKIILEILKEQSRAPGGKLYQMYCERTRFAKAQRTFRNYLRSLCENNLVRAVGTKKGRIYEIVEEGRKRNGPAEVSL